MTLTSNALPAPAETLPPAIIDPAAEVLPEAVIVRSEAPLDGAQLALWNALDRLDTALDHETTELRTLRAANYARLNEAKSRLLLDVSRAARAVDERAVDPRLAVRLRDARAKLEQNRLAVAMHLEAVREIAQAMTQTLIEADSDGTYSARITAQVAAHGDARAARRQNGTDRGAGR